MSSSTPETLTLHSYFASSCGQRILIAAALKGIALTYKPVNLGADENQSADYRSLNPSGGIPVLEVHQNNGSKFVLGQTIAILEYFEERFPKQSPLLPPSTDIETRARVRQMVGIMASDAFPPSNSKVSEKVKAIRGDVEDQKNFVKEINAGAFAAYEILLERHGGKYSVGDVITLADVFLVPQADLAVRYGFDVSKYPRTKLVYDRLMELDSFKKAHWTKQDDTPEKYRSK
jgi:maleylacetoacetate isomerase